MWWYIREVAYTLLLLLIAAALIWEASSLLGRVQQSRSGQSISRARRSSRSSKEGVEWIADDVIAAAAPPPLSAATPGLNGPWVVLCCTPSSSSSGQPSPSLFWRG